MSDGAVPAAAAASAGHRQLSQAEVDAINTIKAKGDELGALLAEAGQLPGVDGRAMAIARTELQTGLMWAVRAVARPTNF